MKTGTTVPILRKALALALSLMLLLTLLPASVSADTSVMENYSNFYMVRSYLSGQFYDVSASDWYYSNVKMAYEFGLTNGKGDSFGASDNLTVAEAITFACRLHKTFNGTREEFLPQANVPWYYTYLGYAISYHIISNNQFTAADYDRYCTRAEFALILSKSFPSDALPYRSGNDLTKLPDVDSSNATGTAIMLLYRAGIVGGMDAVGTFAPDSSITRSQGIAIVTRMAMPELRLPQSTATVSGGNVVEYLRNTAKTRGTMDDSDGNADYIYRYLNEVDSEGSVLCYLVHRPASEGGNLSVFTFYYPSDEDDTSHVCIYFFLSSNLSKPYSGGVTYTDDESGTEIEGDFDLEPSGFSTETALTFSSYDGPSNVKQPLAEMGSLLLGYALNGLNDQVFSGSSYSTRDLGFSGSNYNTNGGSGSSGNVNAGNTGVDTPLPGTGVYSFLESFLTSNGSKDEDGDYLYRYTPSSSYDGDGYSCTFYTYAMTGDDSFDIYMRVNWDDGDIYRCCACFPKSGNASEFDLYTWFRIGDDSYDTYVAVPMSFSGSLPAFDYSDVEDDSDLNGSFHDLAEEMCYDALEVFEEQVLDPGGYTLRDLGLRNM